MLDFLTPRCKAETPTLMLDFTEGLDSRLTFVRATTATYFDSAGVLQSAASGVARTKAHYFNGTVWENFGVWIEDLGKNLCLQSEDLSTTWVNTRSTDATNSIVAPDGNTTADTLKEDGTSASTHSIKQSLVNADFTDDVDYTFSLFVKKTANRNWVKLSSRTKSNVVKNAFFDVNAGTVGAVDTGYTGRIEDVDSGWFRCSISGDIVNGATDPDLIITIAESNNDSVFDGLTQDSLYLWGADVKKGSYPTSYMSTTTAQVTRNAELLTMTDMSWFNEVEGTFFVEFYQPIINRSGRILTVSDGTNDDRHDLLVKNDADTLQYFVKGAATTQADIISGALTGGTLHKAAFAYKFNNFRSVLDGVSQGIDIDGSVPTGLTRLGIGLDSLLSGWTDGFITRIVYYNKWMPVGRLQDRTG